jgi:hypothetical protein
MTDFENRIPEDEAMVDEWPNPEEDYMGDYDDEDDWDDYADEPEGPMDYEVKFKLKGATEEEVRTILKSNGFKWSPSRGAWVRQATGNGQYGARRAMEQLKEHMQKTDPDFAKEVNVSSVFKTEAPKPSGNVSEFESGPIGKGGYYVKFNGEPDEYDKIRLEKHGFKWNEKQGAFVRRSSGYAKEDAKAVRKILSERYKWTNQEAEETREKKLEELLNKLYSNISFG